MAGAEYEVNISLNTKTIDGQLKGLETRINKMRRSINGPLSALQRQANLEDRIKASRVISFRLGTQLNALEQKGVHIVTVNDYLAKRDADWMSKVYGSIGMSTGVIHPQQTDEEKLSAYKCDITYATNNELGFDLSLIHI